MSDSIKVNTANVAAAANKIANYNTIIKKEFSSVEAAIKSLDSTWVGVASNNAISSFNGIKSAYCDARYDVLDNYVTFLRQQIDAGYTQTEKANKSLADALK